MTTRRLIERAIRRELRRGCKALEDGLPFSAARYFASLRDLLAIIEKETR